MEIRPTRSEDSGAIFNLYQQVAWMPGGLARLADEISLAYVEGFVEAALASGVGLVAQTADGKIAGELHACSPGVFCFSHVLTDLTVAVAPEFRQQGIARKLFNTMFAEIAENRRHITRVELIARESNQPALQFYESLGFAREGRLEGRIKNLDGSLEADIPMAWSRASESSSSGT